MPSSSLVSFIFYALGLISWLNPNLNAQETMAYRFDRLQVKLPLEWIPKARGRIIEAKPLYLEAEIVGQEAVTRQKPEYSNMPRHIELRLSPFTDETDHLFHPEITVHPVDQFSKIYFPDPGSVENFTKKFGQIWLTAHKQTVPSHTPLPFIPFLDAHQGVTVAFKPITFPGGKGFRFITQFDIEASLLSEEGLAYIFQALSDDRRTYVLATFPLRLKGLPKSNLKAEHLGYHSDSGGYGRLNREIATYSRKASAWLLQNEANLTPSLATLDAILASLEIEPEAPHPAPPEQ